MMTEPKLCPHLMGAARVHPNTHPMTTVKRHAQCIGSWCVFFGECPGTSVKIMSNGSGKKEGSEEVDDIPKDKGYTKSSGKKPRSAKPSKGSKKPKK